MNNLLPHPPLPSLWEEICAELKQIISPDAVGRWFLPLQIHELTDTELVLRAENTIYQYWIEENYKQQLLAVTAKILTRPVTLRFHAAEAPTPVDSENVPPRPVEKMRASTREQEPSLSPRLTFESFVVGPNSQFAHAAALAVSQAPARTYNPLFLHGNVGLGKTHLMQAIGNFLAHKKRNYKIQYITCEQFTNDYISAVQHGELVKFRRRFRQVDTLLIDDVQFLKEKGKTQDEFFHTFNSLFDGSKQIVLTSDAPPSEMAYLEKRLVSRFEWGLIAELQPPTIETRLAILRHKMSTMPSALPDEVLLFIASRVKSNVRRLEGALTRVAAFAALQSQTVEVAQLERLLKDLLQGEKAQRVSIDLIQRKVAETYDIRLADMTSKRRPSHIAVPRMVAMFLARRLTDCSLNEIGQAFGGRDHGTVINAIKRVDALMTTDNKVKHLVTYLTEKIGGSSSGE